MPELVHIRNAAQTLGKLSRQECIDKYTQRNAGLSSLLVVSANITKEQQKSLDLSNPGSSLLYNRTQDDSGSDWAFQPYWLCSAWPLPQHMQGCAKQFLMPKADNWTVFAANFWDGLSHAEQRRFFWSKVDYCLPLKDQEPMNDRCTLRISTVILSFVSALNLLKILCILYTAHLHHRDFKMTLPENRRTGLLRALDTRLKRKESVDDCHTGPHLVTVGDAIVSFLENEDETTKGSLFATKARFTANTPWDGAFSTVDVGERRWFRSATIMRWSITVSLFVCQFHSNQVPYANTRRCVLMLGIVSVLLGIAIAAQRSAGMPVDLVSLTRHGLGSAQAWSIVLGGTMRKLSQTPGFFFATFLANIAQVVFSALYILYNNLITVMVVASEWNDFISEKKTLRVSRPRGIQRSAYFLSLPYIFSIPLMCFSGLLHWLISQSIFVIQTVGYRTPDFRRAEELDASSIAYSSLGIILAMVFGGIMVLGLPILGILMKYRPGDKLPYPMPLASTCSAAISANCHRHPEDQDCSKLPVRWGFVKDDSVPAGGRFTFTTAIDVEYPSKEEIERLISLGNRSHAVETGSSHA